jgi:hypothetical protein
VDLEAAEEPVNEAVPVQAVIVDAEGARRLSDKILKAPLA